MVRKDKGYKVDGMYCEFVTGWSGKTVRAGRLLGYGAGN